MTVQIGHAAESQKQIGNALVHLSDLESVIHDLLTGNADEYLKAQLLAVTRSIENDLRKAYLL